MGRRWHPTNQGDWRTAAGMGIVSLAITQILRDNACSDFPHRYWGTPCLHNARSDCPYRCWGMPCLQFGDINWAVAHHFKSCPPDCEVITVCMQNHVDQFEEVADDLWALVWPHAYSRAEWNAWRRDTQDWAWAQNSRG